MNAELEAFLFDIRQHALFPQLLAIIDEPKLPGYRPSKSEPLEIVGAKTAYASGQLDQYRLWHSLLTGTDPSDKGDKT
jgi:hypothetical protein